MKKLFSSLVIAGLALLTIPCMAQNGFDPFGGMRTVVVATNQTLLTTTANTLTNAPVDIRIFSGMVSLDLYAQTNSAGATTCTVQTSSDLASWSALGAYAQATPTVVNWTNIYYGTNLIVTNTFLLPGTIVTPNASLAGWATPYLFPAPFTNTGAITMPGNTPVRICFKADDQLRYIRTIWTPSGTVTNVALAATLTGKFTPTNIVP